MPKSCLCDCCTSRVRKNKLRSVKNDAYVRFLKTINESLTSNSKVCPDCFTLAYNNCRPSCSNVSDAPSCSSAPCFVDSTSSAPMEEESRETESDEEATTSKILSPRNIKIDIQRSRNDHKKCVICKRSDRVLKVITSEARCKFFVQQGFLIPPGSRCCERHLILKSPFFIKEEDALSVEPAEQFSMLNCTDIIQLLENVRSMAIK